MVAVAHPGYALPVRRQSAPSRRRLRLPDAAVPAGVGLHLPAVVPLSAARPRRVSPAVYRRRRIVAAMAATVAVSVLATPLSGALRAVAGAAATATATAAAGTAGGTAAGAGADPATAAGVGHGGGRAGRGPTHVHVVAPGETFWSIAREIAPAADPRPVVDRLVAANGGPSLYAGERLVLPGAR